MTFTSELDLDMVKVTTMSITLKQNDLWLHHDGSCQISRTKM